VSWPESWKQSLRHLAAARFYLPVALKGDDEDMYLDYLHNREYKLALGELEAFGIENAGFAQEVLFWRELELAASSMGLADKAKEYGERAVKAQ
jgi:hypothetical protein